jgi:hypothetical protein
LSETQHTPRKTGSCDVCLGIDVIARLHRELRGTARVLFPTVFLADHLQHRAAGVEVIADDDVGSCAQVVLVNLAHDVRRFEVRGCRPHAVPRGGSVFVRRHRTAFDGCALVHVDAALLEFGAGATIHYENVAGCESFDDAA